MNRRSIWAMTLALSLGVVAAPAFAQGNGGARPGAAGLPNGGAELSLLRLPAALATRLELTDEQKQKLTELRERMQEEFRKQLGEPQTGPDRQAVFQKLRDFSQKAETEAAALLTPKQKQQADAMKAEAAQYAGLGPSSIALVAVTGLTDDQKGKLKELSLKTQMKRQQLFQSLQGGGDRQAAIQALRAQSEEMTTGVKQILTPDQQKQFQEALPTGGQFGGRRPINQN